MLEALSKQLKAFNDEIEKIKSSLKSNTPQLAPSTSSSSSLFGPNVNVLILEFMTKELEKLTVLTNQTSYEISLKEETKEFQNRQIKFVNQFEKAKSINKNNNSKDQENNNSLIFSAAPINEHSLAVEVRELLKSLFQLRLEECKKIYSERPESEEVKFIREYLNAKDHDARKTASEKLSRFSKESAASQICKLVAGVDLLFSQFDSKVINPDLVSKIMARLNSPFVTKKSQKENNNIDGNLLQAFNLYSILLHKVGIVQIQMEVVMNLRVIHQKKKVNTSAQVTQVKNKKKKLPEPVMPDISLLVDHSVPRLLQKEFEDFHKDVARINGELANLKKEAVELQNAIQQKQEKIKMINSLNLNQLDELEKELQEIIKKQNEYNRIYKEKKEKHDKLIDFVSKEKSLKKIEIQSQFELSKVKHKKEQIASVFELPLFSEAKSLQDKIAVCVAQLPTSNLDDYIQNGVDAVNNVSSGLSFDNFDGIIEEALKQVFPNKKLADALNEFRDVFPLPREQKSEEDVFSVVLDKEEALQEKIAKSKNLKQFSEKASILLIDRIGFEIKKNLKDVIEKEIKKNKLLNEAFSKLPTSNQKKFIQCIALTVYRDALMQIHQDYHTWLMNELKAKVQLSIHDEIKQEKQLNFVSFRMQVNQTVRDIRNPKILGLCESVEYQVLAIVQSCLNELYPASALDLPIFKKLNLILGTASFKRMIRPDMMALIANPGDKQIKEKLKKLAGQSANISQSALEEAADENLNKLKKIREKKLHLFLNIDKEVLLFVRNQLRSIFLIKNSSDLSISEGELRRLENLLIDRFFAAIDEHTWPNQDEESVVADVAKILTDTSDTIFKENLSPSNFEIASKLFNKSIVENHAKKFPELVNLLQFIVDQGDQGQYFFDNNLKKHGLSTKRMGFIMQNLLYGECRLLISNEDVDDAKLKSIVETINEEVAHKLSPHSAQLHADQKNIARSMLLKDHVDFISQQLNKLIIFSEEVVEKIKSHPEKLNEEEWHQRIHLQANEIARQPELAIYMKNSQAEASLRQMLVEELKSRAFQTWQAVTQQHLQSMVSLSEQQLYRQRICEAQLLYSENENKRLNKLVEQCISDECQQDTNLSSKLEQAELKKISVLPVSVGENKLATQLSELVDAEKKKEDPLVKQNVEVSSSLLIKKIDAAVVKQAFADISSESKQDKKHLESQIKAIESDILNLEYNVKDCDEKIKEILNKKDSLEELIKKYSVPLPASNNLEIDTADQILHKLYLNSDSAQVDYANHEKKSYKDQLDEWQRIYANEISAFKAQASQLVGKMARLKKQKDDLQAISIFEKKAKEECSVVVHLNSTDVESTLQHIGDCKERLSNAIDDFFVELQGDEKDILAKLDDVKQQLQHFSTKNPALKLQVTNSENDSHDEAGEIHRLFNEILFEVENARKAITELAKLQKKELTYSQIEFEEEKINKLYDVVFINLTKKVEQFKNLTEKDYVEGEMKARKKHAESTIKFGQALSRDIEKLSKKLSELNKKYQIDLPPDQKIEMTEADPLKAIIKDLSRKSLKEQYAAYVKALMFMQDKIANLNIENQNAYELVDYFKQIVDKWSDSTGTCHDSVQIYEKALVSEKQRNELYTNINYYLIYIRNKIIKSIGDDKSVYASDLQKIKLLNMQYLACTDKNGFVLSEKKNEAKHCLQRIDSYIGKINEYDDVEVEQGSHSNTRHGSNNNLSQKQPTALQKTLQLCKKFATAKVLDELLNPEAYEQSFLSTSTHETIDIILNKFKNAFNKCKMLLMKDAGSTATKILNEILSITLKISAEPASSYLLSHSVLNGAHANSNGVHHNGAHHNARDNSTNNNNNNNNLQH